MSTASSWEDIGAIQRGTPEVTDRNLIIGGRSGTGLALAEVLALSGGGVMITHSGERKESAVQKALNGIREVFAESGAMGDPEVDVIAIGGDVTTADHRDQIVRAVSLWLPESGKLDSLTLAAARGTKQVQPGQEATAPDPEYARKLNVDGILDVFKRLYLAKTIGGRSLLYGSTVLFPQSTVAHQWEDENAERPDFYSAVGPSKREAEEAILTSVADDMEKVDGRAISVVMGVIEGTLVASRLHSNVEEYFEREDVSSTVIDTVRAGRGMMELIDDPTKYPNRSVVHVLPNSIEVEGAQ